VKDNPLDRVRTNNSRCLESGENCYSIVVQGRDGTRVVLPYSYLQGAVCQDQSCVLSHSLAVVTVAAPPDTIRELTQLLSRQRLAAIRHGAEHVNVSVQLENDIHFR